MQKAYIKRNFKNKPDTTTPLGVSNLEVVDSALDEIDNRVVTFDTTKANQSDLLSAFKSVSFNSSTGVFTFTKFNDTTVTVDTDIEKIAVNFDYDDDPTSAHYQNLVITLEDGTVKYADMSALITVYEFNDTSTIHFAVDNNGEISANIINGSITSSHLSPALQAEINGAEAYSEESEAWAAGTKDGTAVASTDPQYHNNSKYYSEIAGDSAEDSEAWAVGQRGGTDVPSTDPTYENNAKYWAEQAQSMSHGEASNISYDNTTSGMTADDVQEAIDEIATPTFTEASTRANLAGSGESFKTILGKIKKFFTDLATVAFSGSYNDLSNKPSLATVATSGSYNDLSNKPTIPSVGNGTLTIKQAGSSKGTFTANQGGNTTIELTDNNTTYSANNGVGLSGTTFYNSGVRAVSINGNYLRVNTNGTNSDLTIAYATKAGSATDSTKLPLAGGTLTGELYIKSGCGVNLYTPNNGYVYKVLFYDANRDAILRAQRNVILGTEGQVNVINAAASAWKSVNASAFNVQSSRRYKENIEDISEEDASRLLNVRIVKYDYKENVVDEDKRYDRHGVIAEEIVEILPEVVNYAIPYGHEEEFEKPVPDGVDYAKFVPYLIKMVQMQQAEINKLKEMVYNK